VTILCDAGDVVLGGGFDKGISNPATRNEHSRLGPSIDDPACEDSCDTIERAPRDSVATGAVPGYHPPG